MPIASSSTPTSSTPITETDLESGLRPGLARTQSGRSTISSYRLPLPAFPFPTVLRGESSRPSLSLTTIPSSSLGIPAAGQVLGGTTPTPTTEHPPLNRQESSSTPSNEDSGFASSPLASPHHDHMHEKCTSHQTGHSQTTSTHNTNSTFDFSGHQTINTGDSRYDRMVYDYRVLAQSMHAYRPLAIFRRFGKLAMANLLSYQDELAEIETALRALDSAERVFATDVEGNQPMQSSQTEASMRRGSGDSKPHESFSDRRSQSFGGIVTPGEAPSGYLPRLEELKETRCRLMTQLRISLKNYYEALLLQEQVFATLEPPRKLDTDMLSHLEEKFSAAHPEVENRPNASTPFRHELKADDLVGLGLAARDSLEKMVARILSTVVPGSQVTAEEITSNAGRHQSARDVASLLSPFARRITRCVIALGSSLLVLGPMAVLQYVNNREWRLGVVIGFTVLLSMGVAIGTRGRGEGVVMIVAAYAAVLVVFVQGNGGMNGC